MSVFPMTIDAHTAGRRHRVRPTHPNGTGACQI